MPESSEDGFQMFTVRLPVELHDELRRAAFERRISMAEVVREALERWLREESEGNENAPQRAAA